MRILLISCFCFICLSIHAQSKLGRGGIIVKWDMGRLLNPFNSTIQVGAEFGINESLTIHSDVGINSNLFEDTYYNRGVFISHNQLRRYMRRGNFYGIDLFYIHAKDFSDAGCFYDKNKKISGHYDSVTLIKTAPGLAIITGNQLMIGKFTLDILIGAGVRLVNNKLDYQRQTFTGGDCETTHFAWHNDRYSGRFLAGHVSFGAKLGYIVKRKNKG